MVTSNSTAAILLCFSLIIAVALAAPEDEVVPEEMPVLSQLQGMTIGGLQKAGAKTKVVKGGAFTGPAPAPSPENYNWMQQCWWVKGSGEHGQYCGTRSKTESPKGSAWIRGSWDSCVKNSAGECGDESGGMGKHCNPDGQATECASKNCALLDIDKPGTQKCCPNSHWHWAHYKGGGGLNMAWCSELDDGDKCAYDIQCTSGKCIHSRCQGDRACGTKCHGGFFIDHHDTRHPNYCRWDSQCVSNKCGPLYGALGNWHCKWLGEGEGCTWDQQCGRKGENLVCGQGEFKCCKKGSEGCSGLSWYKSPNWKRHCAAVVSFVEQLAVQAGGALLGIVTAGLGEAAFAALDASLTAAIDTSVEASTTIVSTVVEAGSEGAAEAAADAGAEAADETVEAADAAMANESGAGDEANPADEPDESAGNEEEEEEAKKREEKSKKKLDEAKEDNEKELEQTEEKIRKELEQQKRNEQTQQELADGAIKDQTRRYIALMINKGLLLDIV